MLLWSPSEAFKNNAHLTHYLQWLAAEKSLHFDSYSELWHWSTS